MLLRLLDNGEIEFPITIEELQQRFPLTSFALPITESALPSGYMPVYVESGPPESALGPRQKIDLGPPQFDETKWVQNWVIREMTNDELNKVAHEKVKERNRLLAETDWTQLPDVSQEISTRYLPYRQKLRDITKDPNFPFIEFPEA
jgi:hypothetical protein